MEHNVYVYFLVAAIAVYLLRSLPITLIQKPIESRFLRSFLYYVPYVTLSIMVFPAILSSTQSLWSGLAGFLAASIVAWLDGNLFKVAICSCIAVSVVELLPIG